MDRVIRNGETIAILRGLTDTQLREMGADIKRLYERRLATEAVENLPKLQAQALAVDEVINILIREKAIPDREL